MLIWKAVPCSFEKQCHAYLKIVPCSFEKQCHAHLKNSVMLNWEIVPCSLEKRLLLQNMLHLHLFLFMFSYNRLGFFFFLYSLCVCSTLCSNAVDCFLFLQHLQVNISNNVFVCSYRSPLGHSRWVQLIIQNFSILSSLMSSLSLLLPSPNPLPSGVIKWVC